MGFKHLFFHLICIGCSKYLEEAKIYQLQPEQRSVLHSTRTKPRKNFSQKPVCCWRIGRFWGTGCLLKQTRLCWSEARHDRRPSMEPKTVHGGCKRISWSVSLVLVMLHVRIALLCLGYMFWKVKNFNINFWILRSIDFKHQTLYNLAFFFCPFECCLFQDFQ